MGLRMCKRRGCKSRNRKAVYLIDRVPYCYSCTEKWLETHFFDEHSVHRISDNDADFGVKVHCGTTSKMPVAAIN